MIFQASDPFSRPSIYKFSGCQTPFEVIWWENGKSWCVGVKNVQLPTSDLSLLSDSGGDERVGPLRKLFHYLEEGWEPRQHNELMGCWYSNWASLKLYLRLCGSTSIFYLWFRPWVVARQLSLYGVHPCLILRKGPSSTTTTAILYKVFWFSTQLFLNFSDSTIFLKFWNTELFEKFSPLSIPTLKIYIQFTTAKTTDSQAWDLCNFDAIASYCFVLN